MHNVTRSGLLIVLAGALSACQAPFFCQPEKTTSVSSRTRRAA